MKINLVICPMKEEMDELLKKVGTYTTESYGEISGYQFKIGAENYFAFLGKIGKTNIGYDIGYLAAQLSIGKIYNVGVAGSLKADIVPLNVVVADKVCYYDADLTAGGNSKYALGQMAGEEDLYFHADKEPLSNIEKLNTTLTIRVGTIISGDSFATKGNMKEDLLKHFDNPLAVDMESGAVGQAAKRLRVPFTVIRGISDNVFGEGDNNEVFYEFLSLSARRAASVFMHLVNKEYTEAEDSQSK
jgi:5'-methylthioadenosine/S-adenosylhomocysteine nucleosidase